MSKEVLVEGLKVPAAAGSLTGTDLIDYYKKLPMSKGRAVRIIAIDLAMKDVVEKAKKYLLTRCADTGAYLDPDTGLEITTTDNTRTTVTSDLIESYQKLINAEIKAIKKGVKSPGALVKSTPYKKFHLTKRK